MEPKLHFSFDAAAFNSIVAHGGDGEILWYRADHGTTLPNINFIDITILPPKTSIGLHTHLPDNVEIYIIIAGTGRMMLDDASFGVAPGHVIVNRPGGTHALENTGDSELRLVVIEVSASTIEANKDLDPSG